MYCEFNGLDFHIKMINMTMMNKMNIRKRFLLLLLSAGVLSFIVLGSVSLWGIYDVQQHAMENGIQMGEDAADSMEKLTVNLAQKRLSAVAYKKANIVDRELQTIKEDTARIADTMERILSHPEGRIPRPVKSAWEKPIYAGEAWIYYPPSIRSPEAQAALSAETGLASCIADTLENMGGMYMGYKGFIDIVSESGYYLCVDTLDKGQQEVNLTEEFLSNYVPKETNWYKDAMSEGKIVVSDVYLDENTHIPFISFSIPYRDGTEFAGVANISLNAQSLQKVVNDNSMDVSGVNFVMNNKGRIIFSSKETGVLSAFDGENDLRKSSEPGLAEIATSMVEGGSGVASVNVEGDSYYLAFAPIPSAGWSICTLARADEIVAPAQAAYNSVQESAEEFALSIASFFQKNIWVIWIMLFAILAVLAAVSRIVAEWFVTPILVLTAGVRDIAKGNFERKLDIRTGDEIEELSESVNRMTDELKKYMDNIARATADRQRISTELSLAQGIQEGMLPKIFSKIANNSHYEIFATMEAAKSVGGDFYDYYVLDSNHLAVTIADVSGKGIPAALFMMIAKTILKNNAISAHKGNSGTMDWSKVLEQSNRQLCENNEEMMFVTVFFGVLNIVTGEFFYVNCGHNSPLIGRISGGKTDWQYIRDSRKSPMIGVLESADYTERCIKLLPGDMLYLYTDGVTEAMDEEKNLYTEDRLQQILNRKGQPSVAVRDILTSVREDIDIHAKGAEQSDDITMFCIRFCG